MMTVLKTLKNNTLFPSLLSILLLFSSTGQALTVISDLDDTLKVTNVSSIPKTIKNFFLSKKAFQAMPELMRTMNEYADFLHILTRSPTLIRPQIKGFLKKHHIPYDKLMTLNILKGKFHKMRSIQENLDDEMILIGDNVQLDEKIYWEVSRRYPFTSIKVYIHKIKNTPNLFKDTITFFTAFEIAFEEHLDDRMDFAQLSSIAQIILEEKQMERVIPSFAHCPTKKEEFHRQTTHELFVQVQAKVLGYCRFSSSHPNP